MLIKRSDDIQPSEITPRSVFRERRRFMRDAAGVATAAVLGGGLSLLGPRGAAALATDPDATGRKLEGVVESAWRTDEELTPYSDITSYNNFYEFGTDKSDPARHADKFTPMPWKVKVLGECEKPGMYDYEDIVQPHRLEERIYRLRCVEAWSMVIPWVGIPLGGSPGAIRPDLEGEVRRVPHRLPPRVRCGASIGPFSTGPTSRGCGSTRRCTR